MALDAVLEEIRPTPDDTIICLGDFIDSGRETKDVISRLIRLQDECQLVMIQGNHEEMMLAALESPRLLDSWLMCGGMETINSYKFCGRIDAIDPDHIEFIRACRDYYETDSHILVHANYDPDLPMADLPPHTLRWSLLEKESVRRHVSGKTVIVGHTEQRNGEILDLGCVVCIDTCCHGYGWLTAYELNTGHVWQASRWGALREPGEGLAALRKASVLLHHSPLELVPDADP